jgi:DNA-binding NtrC family response regulator
MFIRVLLLVESSGLRTRLCQILKSLGVFVTEENDPDNLWIELGRENHDLIVASSTVFRGDAEKSIAEIRGLPSRPEIIVLLDSDQQDQRSHLQSGGAFAVIDEDLSLVSLSETMAGILERYREIGVRRFTEDRQQQTSLDDFSSDSPAMTRLLELARRVTHSDTSLLILGETGVGKEWLAKAIHEGGPRGAAPFIAVNCAAVPETLLESELFGHERGAFTGATRARRGCFEMAHRGTLFLDEVAEIPVHLQVKLLRALQDKTIQRLGAESPLRVDVRLMAATNQELEEAMSSGRFRRDLYYRLSVVTLTVPPLRERREDIVPLVQNYMAEYRRQLGRSDIEGIERPALDCMRAYDWPGNVRELINVVERAVLLCDRRAIGLDHLPEVVTGLDRSDRPGSRRGGPGSGGDSLLSRSLVAGRRKLVADYEREYLVRALERTRGNIGRTARIAGVDPRTIYNKMQVYGLRKDSYRKKLSPPSESRNGW